MSTVELTLRTDESVAVEHGRNKNQVVIQADPAEVLNHFSLAEIVAHFDKGELLDEIGSKYALEHFDVEA